MEFTDRELNVVRTIGDVVTLVRSKLQAASRETLVPPAPVFSSWSNEINKDTADTMER
jgi:hypothetical protein